MSDQLYFISCLSRHCDYNWMIQHLQHISMWDAQRNFIFREVLPVISEEEYMRWYLSITYRIIIFNPVQVFPHEEMEYEPHACRIQNVISIYYFL